MATRHAVPHPVRAEIALAEVVQPALPGETGAGTVLLEGVDAFDELCSDNTTKYY
jgi:hypothetical protein